MPTNAQLKTVADALEAQDSVRAGNSTEAGWWRRIALAAEGIAGASTSANAGIDGWMLRAATALEAVGGTSGAEENVSREGLLKRCVDALEALGSVSVGSLAGRFAVAAVNAQFVVNLLTNGDFATGDLTGWTNNDQGTGTSTVVGEVAQLTGVDFANRAEIYQSFPTEIGREYSFSMDLTGGGGSIAQVGTGVASNAYFGQNPVGNQTYAFTFTATTTTAFVTLRNQNSAISTLTADNVSCQLV